MKKSSVISSTPNIMGGEPVIAGTRVPIGVILYRIKEGYTLEQIHDMYQHVSTNTLQKMIEEIAQKIPAITKHGKALLQA